MKSTSRKSSRRSAIAGLLSLPLAGRAIAGPPRNDASSANVGDLLAVRERVWRQWFAGDRKALMDILPADFVGISAGDSPFRNREEAIKDSEGFVAAGNTLADLRFSDNHIQTIGNATIIYCRFSFTVQGKDGAPRTTVGRATEVFSWTGKRWLHPGWHLDSGK
jgi:ketosteroid isomerase-like protein